MNPRIAWFAAGAATGVWAVVKARRTAYRLSPPGLIDQAGALGVGVRAFADEVREGMAAREHELTHQLHPDPVVVTTERDAPDGDR